MGDWGGGGLRGRGGGVYNLFGRMVVGCAGKLKFIGSLWDRIFQESNRARGNDVPLKLYLDIII